MNFVTLLAPSKCMSVNGASQTVGTQLVISTCSGATNQSFTWQSNGEIRIYGTLCVDVGGKKGADLDPIVIATCNGSATQKWTTNSSNGIQGVNAKCIDITSSNSADGTKLILFTCKGSYNQRWDSKTSSATSSPPSVGFAAVKAGIRPRGFGQATYMLSSPVGGLVYYVAKTGSDANPGTSAAPFRTINRAAQVAKAGDVVTIRAGTYSETVVVRNSGAAGAPIVFQAEQRGQVVLTGSQYSWRPYTWSGGVQETGQLFITLRGLIFRQYAPNMDASPGPSYPAAVKAARNWTIEDCLFDNAGTTGLQIRGSNVLVTKSTFQYAYEQAFDAWAPANNSESATDSRYHPLDNIRITDVVMRSNYTLNVSKTAAGTFYVVKFTTSRGTVLDNIESYQNHGSGMWFDGRNSNITIRNSYFHDNYDISGTSQTGRGVNFEINWGPVLVEGNLFLNNQGPALAITNTAGVTVRNNLIGGNFRSITFMDVDRGTTSTGQPMFPTKNETIKGNQFKDWTNFDCQQSGGLLSSPLTANIVSDSNTYQPVTESRVTYWPSNGSAYTLADLRTKYGWELNGKFASITVP